MVVQLPFASAPTPLNTSLTYQGRLNDGNVPANGTYDFQFALFDVVGNLSAPVLEAARREQPDLIVCDVQLPELDGYEVARWLKSDPVLRSVPLVAVTALAMVIVVGGAVAGYGIANEFKWAYALGIVMAILPFVLRFWLTSSPLSSDLITLMFQIALVALLLHPQSRDYQRIWFK